MSLINVQTASSETTLSTGRRIRVLIVDDSAVVRTILARELSRDPDIEVVGSAPDPYVARDKVVALQPDVLTLDVEMPRMDGISFLKKLMQFMPMPVIVISSLATTGSKTVVDALGAGAVDVVAKPGSSSSVDGLASILIQKIKIAASARVMKVGDSERPGPRSGHSGTSDRIFAIGASTGDVQALTTLLEMLPENAPGTVIVQHMPPKFTLSFANRLNERCAIRVKEAADGDEVVAGRALLAPGGFHLLLRRAGQKHYVEVKDGPEVFHQKPSVDVLFQSVARAAGANGVGAILTGMGADGAKGLLEMKKAGARTIAQNQASCVVFGMPMEAIKISAAEHVLDLREIAPKMLELAQAR